MRPLLTFLALLAALMGAPAAARDYAGPGYVVADPWSRPAPAGGNGAGFISVTNTGAAPLRLETITSPRAERIEIHRTVESSGVFSMTPVRGGLLIGPGETLVLGPGGYHAMIVGLRGATVPGDQLPATLTFSRGGQRSSIDVSFAVQVAPPGAHH